MRIAYLDCASGISGDMMLAALVDAGVELAALNDAIASLGLVGCRLVGEQVKKKGFRATQIRVKYQPEHVHRHLHHILAMIDGSNIPADRISKFAIIRINPDGTMAEIIEKPTDEQLAGVPKPHYVSMNCWRFGPAIFKACRAIKPSVRNEFEVTDAVAYAINQLGQTFTAARTQSPVLDMSCRDDIGPVAQKLRGTKVEL